jgi:predicted dehydrogenase
MRKLKVGLVGITRGGSYGELVSRHPRTEVAVVCDINEKNLEQAGKEFKLKDKYLFKDYDAFINGDIDIVFIGSPLPFHSDQSIKALENNKHVLSEVTAANSIEECEALFRAAMKSKAKYMMAENCCYFHFIREFENLIKKGKIGETYYMEGEYVHQLRDRIYNKETGEVYWRINRPPLHYCSHSLGPLLMFLENDYIVKATGSGKKANIIPNLGPGAINMQVALFETKKGVIIKLLRSSVVSREPLLGFYSVYGTKGFLETGREGYDTKGRIYFEDEDKEAREVDCFMSDPNAPEETKTGGHGTSEYYLLQDFINCIDNNTKPPIDIVKALEMTIPGIIAHQAVIKGNVWFDVPHFE